MIEKAVVLKFVHSRRYRPMTAQELGDRLGARDEDREQLNRVIKELQLAGELVEVKKRRLVDPARVELVVGTLMCNPRGFGFIVQAREADGEDVYVSGENMSSALHGDVVVARVPGGRQPRPPPRSGRKSPSGEAKIISVLKRARTEIVGTFRGQKHVRYVVPDDPRLFRDVMVGAEDTADAQHNDKVRVRITLWPTRHINPAGEVVEVFGPRGLLEAEISSAVCAFNLRREFPQAVLHAVRRLPQQVPKSALGAREDLTSAPIITIDPEDARDFDDAVSVRRTASGGWELGVHIADVSHYVKADGPADREARVRGTSVYLPGQVIPMLPEALSNRLCSLRPNEVRLTKTVRMRYDAEGRLRRTQISDSFIKSARRFTYKEVQRVFEGGKLSRRERPWQETLLEMRTLAERLRQRRREAGMIELDIPEPHIIADDGGRTIGIELKRSDDAHRLIEQFMLAANEAVANYLIRRKLPYLCRAHDEPGPKALTEFRESARALGHNLPAPGTREQIQRFLARVQGEPEESALHYLLLRSMKPAGYSAEDKPHYAIAARHYLHFTSPIRRYPDLLVHRILDEARSGRLKSSDRTGYWKNNLPVWAANATQAERNAEEAERTMTRARLFEFIADKHEPMAAMIIATESYGLKVQLCNSLVEGVIRMSALSDGFYRLDRRRRALVGPRGKEYRVGRKLRVRVLHYDEFKHQIEFEPDSPRRHSQVGK